MCYNLSEFVVAADSVNLFKSRLDVSCSIILLNLMKLEVGQRNLTCELGTCEAL